MSQAEAVIEEVEVGSDLALQEAKELATLEAEMEAEAAKMREELSTPSSRISTKGGIFTPPENISLGAKIEIVVLGHIRSNVYYSTPYNANKPTPPDCFATGRDVNGGKDMKPSKQVEKPQFKDCEDCPNQIWGSSPTGKGKACRNEFIVAIAIPAFSERIYELHIPPTAMDDYSSIMSTILASGHPTKMLMTAEFVSKGSYSVPKITGGVPNPDMAKHFRMSKDAVNKLLDK